MNYYYYHYELLLLLLFYTGTKWNSCQLNSTRNVEQTSGPSGQVSVIKWLNSPQQDVLDNSFYWCQQHNFKGTEIKTAMQHNLNNLTCVVITYITNIHYSKRSYLITNYKDVFHLIMSYAEVTLIDEDYS